MDFGAFTIGGISVLVLVLGIVEAAKRFGVQGTASEVLAVVLGFLFVSVAVAIDRGFIGPDAASIIEIAVMGLGGALAATGVYDLVRKGRMPPGG